VDQRTVAKRTRYGSNKLETAIANAADKDVIASQASVNQAQSNVNQARSCRQSSEPEPKQVVAPIDGIVRVFPSKRAIT